MAKTALPLIFSWRTQFFLRKFPRWKNLWGSRDLRTSTLRVKSTPSSTAFSTLRWVRPTAFSSSSGWSSRLRLISLHWSKKILARYAQPLMYSWDLKSGWLKRGWVANGLDFDWDLKCGQMAAILSNHLKSGQMFGLSMPSFCKIGTSWASAKAWPFEVWSSKSSGFFKVEFWIPTVIV